MKKYKIFKKQIAQKLNKNIELKLYNQLNFLKELGEESEKQIG